MTTTKKPPNRGGPVDNIFDHAWLFFLNYNSQNNTAEKPILHYATHNTKK